MSAPVHVAIVGGGVAGLTTAYELQESARAAGLPLKVMLLESDRTTGGKLITERIQSPIGEWIVEGGPDSFLSQKPWAAELCRRLGLANDLIPTNDDRRGVYILRGGRLRRLPAGMNLIVPTKAGPFLRSSLLSWPGKLRMALEIALPARRDGGDESLAEFVGRRFGREAVEILAEPLMAGIYAADPERQSIGATFGRFREMERTHRSLILGTRKAQQEAARRATGSQEPGSMFLSLRGGTAQLAEALRAALGDEVIITGAQVSGLHRRAEGGYRLDMANGTSVEAGAVVLATPAYVSGALLEPVVPELAKMLTAIRYVSTATVSLGFRREDVAHALDGFGFVIPRSENRRIFGCTWSSTKFDHRAPIGGALLRCFVGGSGREELVELNDAALVALARQELSAIMGFGAKPLIARVFRWRRSNPQYDVGHAERVQAMYGLCAQQPGLYLAGGAYEGVGVPDCVRQAQATARKVLEQVVPIM